MWPYFLSSYLSRINFKYTWFWSFLIILTEYLIYKKISLEDFNIVNIYIFFQLVMISKNILNIFPCCHHCSKGRKVGVVVVGGLPGLGCHPRAIQSTFIPPPFAGIEDRRTRGPKDSRTNQLCPLSASHRACCSPVWGSGDTDTRTMVVNRRGCRGWKDSNLLYSHICLYIHHLLYGQTCKAIGTCPCWSHGLSLWGTESI